MTNVTKKDGDQLFVQIAALIEDAREEVAATVNLAMVYTYFEIGQIYSKSSTLSTKSWAELRFTLGSLPYLRLKRIVKPAV